MRRTLLLLVILLLLSVWTAGASETPVAVSPGSPTGSLIGDECPTFSWGAVDGAKFYELVVYRVEADTEEAKSVLRQRISGSALGWTPSLDSCLLRGGQYAWSVRATGGSKESEWSALSIFKVAAPSEAKFEAALATVRQYLATQGMAALPAAKSAVATDGTETEVEVSPAGDSSQALLAPAKVSLVTEGAIGVGTSTPLADLHVLGGSTTAGILVGTSERGTSELLLASDPIGDYGMKLKYDGVPGVNTFELWGRSAGVDLGPWLSIQRSTGAATFGGTITGDGSGLTAVDADTLDGMDSTTFSTGPHTANELTISDLTCIENQVPIFSGAVWTCGYATCRGPGPENTELACSDGCDNDTDSFVDCDDFDCDGTQTCGCLLGPENNELACADGCDNDNDSYVDCDDFDCDQTHACCESGPEDTELACADGCDNDGDGYVDCDDFDCLATEVCQPG